MISELFGLLSSIDVTGKGKNRKFAVNLNKNRIRSISAFSSNSIFYFPTIVSDQTMPEEQAMIIRMVEKAYASFVVACISLMPFHRIKADDKASIEDYLSQFHQNIGMNQGSGPVLNKVFGYVDGMDISETVAKMEGFEETQDFLQECWIRSMASQSDPIKIIAETVSLNDMFSEDPIDPKTKVIQEQFKLVQEELDTWGFIGEATDDLLDSDMDNLLEMSDEEIERSCEEQFKDRQLDTYLKGEGEDPESLTEGNVKSAVDSIKFSLESVSANKIMSCQSLTKLAQLESKLNKLKNKYTKYLNRYKKRVQDNKKNGEKKSLAIRFNGFQITNPKAFMKQYGTYIKIINKRLKLIDKRRAELRKRKGLPEENKKLEENVITELTQMDFDALDHCIGVIDESLSAPDSEIFIITEANGGEWLTDAELDMITDYIHDLEAEKRANASEIQKLEKAVATVRSGMAAQTGVHQKEIDDLEQKLAAVTRKSGLQTKANQKLKDQIADLRKASDDRQKAAKQAEQNKTAHDYAPGESDFARPKSGYIPGRRAGSGDRSYKTFDKEVFTDMDVKKANEAIPMFARATISFIVDETEEVVARDVLIGVKAYIHKAPASELVNDVYNCIINKRKFLRFVKFITGEERSLSDLLFGFKELKNDALDARSGAGEWRQAFKRRRRWAKMSVPYLMKEYTPNGTLVMTMNEVQFIKDQYGIDIMKPDHVRMIMDADFLLGFIIIDQAEEMVYVTYDGHGYGFQQYTYPMLERERQQTDREMRNLYRTIAGSR